MSKLKMLKLPKKPKRSASLESKQKFLAKVREIQHQNQKRHKLNVDSERLSKVIAGIGSISVLPSGFSARSIRPSKARKAKSGAKKSKAKKAAPKRKAAKKKR
ncbi:MAG: hypothetical protein ABIQ88_02360 [Chitinophagaceae bacterium]